MNAFWFYGNKCNYINRKCRKRIVNKNESLHYFFSKYQNNIYLDDINIKTQIINPNLKARGFLVTPVPAAGNITVQFYPNPVNLRSIQLYNILGQKPAETSLPQGQGAPSYNFNISRYAPGTYIVRAVFSDKVLTKKIIKN